ncbi:MAG TPA: NAD(P)H-hydrate dehydratase [Patescibacteria group bacterium]|nr:NAD(P)H-hydrate dehydratase [Patescibacteria group bacterium]
MKTFDKNELHKLFKPKNNSLGEQNGQVTIIGGSSLFHGAPLLAVKAASRIVDMVFFSSPEPSVGDIANNIKSELMSFIWVPWNDVEAYIKKSDAVLMGPGLMRFTSESQIPNDKFQISNDREGKKTREITERLLTKFKSKKWVIDAGSLQTMDAKWIPPRAIITPNRKEMEMLFKLKTQDVKLIQAEARKYNCIIVAKGPETNVASPSETVAVTGGNPGLTKGGTGDILAGLTVGLLAKNDPFLAAAAASYLIKAAADELHKMVGVNYNSDDLSDQIPKTLKKISG